MPNSQLAHTTLLHIENGLRKFDELFGGSGRFGQSPCVLRRFGLTTDRPNNSPRCAEQVCTGRSCVTRSCRTRNE